MKTIPVHNGTKDALVDDEQYDRVSRHHWFFHKNHVYAKLYFPTGKEKPPTFGMLVRLDAFILNYSPKTNLNIKHVNRDPYDCQRSNLYPTKRSAGPINEPKSSWVGVYKKIPKSRFGEVWFTKLGDRFEEDVNDEWLAKRHDEWIMENQGDRKRLNFLQAPVIGRLKKKNAGNDSEESEAQGGMDAEPISSDASPDSHDT